MSSKACPQPAISERRRGHLPAAGPQGSPTARPSARGNHGGGRARQVYPGPSQRDGRQVAFRWKAGACRTRSTFASSVWKCRESTCPASLMLSQPRLDTPHRIPAVVHHVLEGRRAFCSMWRRLTLWKTTTQQLEIPFGSCSALERRMRSAMLRASAGFSLSRLPSPALGAGGRTRLEWKDSRAGESTVRVWEGLKPSKESRTQPSNP